MDFKTLLVSTWTLFLWIIVLKGASGLTVDVCEFDYHLSCPNNQYDLVIFEVIPADKGDISWWCNSLPHCIVSGTAKGCIKVVYGCKLRETSKLAMDTQSELQTIDTDHATVIVIETEGYNEGLKQMAPEFDCDLRVFCKGSHTLSLRIFFASFGSQSFCFMTESHKLCIRPGEIQQQVYDLSLDHLSSSSYWQSIFSLKPEQGGQTPSYENCVSFHLRIEVLKSDSQNLRWCNEPAKLICRRKTFHNSQNVCNKYGEDLDNDGGKLGSNNGDLDDNGGELDNSVVDQDSNDDRNDELNNENEDLDKNGGKLSNNDGNLSNNGGEMNNYGTELDYNGRKLDNNSDLDNYDGKVGNAGGELENNGNFDNSGVLDNNGNLDNVGLDLNNNGRKLDNSGGVLNFNGGEVNNNGKDLNNNEFDGDDGELGNDGGVIDNNGTELENNNGELDNDDAELNGEVENNGGELDNGKLDTHNGDTELDGDMDNNGEKIDNNGGELDNGELDNGDVELDRDVDNNGGELDNNGEKIDNNEGEVDNKGTELENNGEKLDNDNGELKNSSGKLNNNVGRLDNNGEFNNAGQLDNSGGKLNNNGREQDINAGQLDNNAGQLVNSGGNLNNNGREQDINAGQLDNNAGQLGNSGGNLNNNDINAGQLDNNAGQLGNSGGKLNNNSREQDINAWQLDNNAGQLGNSVGELNNNGRQQDINGGQLDNYAGQLGNSVGELNNNGREQDINGGQLDNYAGQLGNSGGELNNNGRQQDINGGVLDKNVGDSNAVLQSKQFEEMPLTSYLCLWNYVLNCSKELDTLLIISVDPFEKGVATSCNSLRTCDLSKYKEQCFLVTYRCLPRTNPVMTIEPSMNAYRLDMVETNMVGLQSEDYKIGSKQVAEDTRCLLEVQADAAEEIKLKMFVADFVPNSANKKYCLIVARRRFCTGSGDLEQETPEISLDLDPTKPSRGSVRFSLTWTGNRDLSHDVCVAYNIRIAVLRGQFYVTERLKISCDITSDVSSSTALDVCETDATTSTDPWHMGSSQLPETTGFVTTKSLDQAQETSAIIQTATNPLHRHRQPISPVSGMPEPSPVFDGSSNPGHHNQSMPSLEMSTQSTHFWSYVSSTLHTSTKPSTNEGGHPTQSKQPGSIEDQNSKQPGTNQDGHPRPSKQPGSIEDQNSKQPETKENGKPNSKPRLHEMSTQSTHFLSYVSSRRDISTKPGTNQGRRPRPSKQPESNEDQKSQQPETKEDGIPSKKPTVDKPAGQPGKPDVGGNGKLKFPNVPGKILDTFNELLSNFINKNHTVEDGDSDDVNKIESDANGSDSDKTNGGDLDDKNDGDLDDTNNGDSNNTNMGWNNTEPEGFGSWSVNRLGFRKVGTPVAVAVGATYAFAFVFVLCGVLFYVYSRIQQQQNDLAKNERKLRERDLHVHWTEEQDKTNYAEPLVDTVNEKKLSQAPGGTELNIVDEIAASDLVCEKCEQWPTHEKPNTKSFGRNIIKGHPGFDKPTPVYEHTISYM